MGKNNNLIKTIVKECLFLLMLPIVFFLIISSLNGKKLVYADANCTSPGESSCGETCCTTTCVKPDANNKASWHCQGGGNGGPTQRLCGAFNNYCGGTSCEINAANGWSCPCKYGGTWGGWSACSASCGGGTKTRYNNEGCAEPQTQACNTQSCTPPSPTATSTPVPTATATPVPNNSCPATKSKGDANCSGCTDPTVDYSIWLNSQCHPATGQSCADKRADFNSDGNVDDADYDIWKANASPACTN